MSDTSPLTQNKIDFLNNMKFEEEGVKRVYTMEEICANYKATFKHKETINEARKQAYRNFYNVT